MSSSSTRLPLTRVELLTSFKVPLSVPSPLTVMSPCATITSRRSVPSAKPSCTAGVPMPVATWTEMASPRVLIARLAVAERLTTPSKPTRATLPAACMA